MNVFVARTLEKIYRDKFPTSPETLDEIVDAWEAAGYGEEEVRSIYSETYGWAANIIHRYYLRMERDKKRERDEKIISLLEKILNEITFL